MTPFVEGQTKTFLCPEQGKRDPDLTAFIPPTLKLIRNPGGEHDIPCAPDPNHCKVVSGTYGTFPFTLDFEWTAPNDSVGVIDWNDAHLAFDDAGNGMVRVTYTLANEAAGTFSGRVVDASGKTVLSWGSTDKPGASGLVPWGGALADYGMNCLSANFCPAIAGRSSSWSTTTLSPRLSQ